MPSLDDAREVLAEERCSGCLLDAAGRIVAVNGTWDGFAAANGGAPACLGVAVRGRDYRDFADGEAARALVDGLVGRALAGAAAFAEVECNSPGVHRLLRSQFIPVGGGEGVVGVLVIHAVLREFAAGAVHPPAPADGAVHRHVDGLFRLCLSCLRAHRPGDGTWDFVPEYVAQRPAPLRWVICPPCAMRPGMPRTAASGG